MKITAAILVIHNELQIGLERRWRH